MNNLKFYVFTNKGIKRSDLLMDCIRWYIDETNDTSYKGYIALGISNGNSEIDLLHRFSNTNKNLICEDYKCIDEFKNNKLISVNIINTLKKLV